MRLFRNALLTWLVCLFLPHGHAQAPRTGSAAHALMLSDIHFDPFHDPAKAAKLAAAPIEQWPAILSAPEPSSLAEDLRALQESCGSRPDTAWPLLQTTLASARAEDPRPTFVTLSGDLLTHEFPCRFRKALPAAGPNDLAAFAAKTTAFVVQQLQAAFPRSPIYTALGNNDSGCADYRETPGDLYMASSARALAAAARPHGDPVQSSPEGDYSVLLPAPVEHTRLIVLNNIFASHQYNTCGGAADRAPEKAQIDWLRSQLSAARGQHEQVWVMAHIPPGIDVYSSFRSYIFRPGEVCSAHPYPFLADPSFPDALLDYADIVRLALFGHTHMDEFRVMHRDATAHEPEATVPAKIVPSITPYAGNHPAFLVATIDPHTAVLKDWRTVVSPGAQGSSAPWTEAYRFTTAYHLPDFSAASAAKLSASFTEDHTAQGPDSTTFRQHFYPGDIGLYAMGLAQLWPAYACSVRSDRLTALHNCLCPPK